MLLLLLLAAGSAGAACSRWSGEGTTLHLQSIFLGRCAEYLALLNPQLWDKNCTAIWEAFRAVLEKDPCSVFPSDYDLFINLSRHSIPRDKSLFWENNESLVSSYAEISRRFTPVSHTLYGRVGELLSWVSAGKCLRESCGEGSVKILEERLEETGFQYSCINDHLPVKLLKCVDHSTHPDCALKSNVPEIGFDF